MMEKLQRQGVKDLARKAYSDQKSQDTEGGAPCPISFIAGFVNGYNKALEQMQEKCEQYIEVRQLQKGEDL